MPAAVGAAIVSNYVATTVAVNFGTSLLVSQVVGAVAGFATSSIIGAAFRDGPDEAQQQPFEQELRDNLVTVRQPITHWQYIYGRARVGGAMTFAHESADDNFHIVITLAGHVCQEIEAVWFNDEVVPLDGSGNATGRYAGYVRILKSLGAEAGQPFAALVAESEGKWTDAHRQSGRTKIYLRLTPNADLFPTGIPNITAVVKGKKVYDPRSTLTAWSDNASLCIADFLCDSVWLDATYATEIDETQLIAAANIDDESVNLNGGGSEARYTLNGAFSVNVDSRSVLERLLTANAGRVHYIGGVFRILPAAYVTPTLSFGVGDLRGVPRIAPRLSAAELANGVKGVYVSEENLWQPTDFPPVVNATYLAEDQAERSWRELDLPFTKSAATAQRIAKIELERMRQQISVEWPGKFTCFRAQPGDTVQITFSMMGWTTKVFEVVAGGLAVEDGGEGAVRLGSDLSLRETASTVFDWNSGEETLVDAAPDTNLPDPFTVNAPVNVAAYSGNDELFLAADGTVISRLRVVWDDPMNAFVSAGGKVLLQLKPATDSIWQDVLPVSGDALQTLISPVQDGTLYDVRVRFENSMGVRSSWTAIQHTVSGKTALPSDVELFTIEGTRLTWTPVTDSDVIGYRLRFQPNQNTSWGDATPMHQGLITDSPFDMPIVPSGANTLMVKAVDYSGNESQNPATIYTDLGDPIVANVVETVDWKALGFPGTKTNGSVSGGNLVADSSTLMWKANSAANWWDDDSATLLWSAASYAQMTYVDTLTITSALSGSRLTIGYTIAGDPWTLEYRENSARLLWSADSSTLMWSSTDTDYMWDQPAWLSWPGAIDVGNSVYDFRITTGQGATQGVVSEFVFTIDAPDVAEVINDVSIGSGGTRLTLTKTYSVVKNVQLTVQNDGGTAITARTEDKSATLGPLIKCLDAAGSATTGLVDARIQGY